MATGTIATLVGISAAMTAFLVFALQPVAYRLGLLDRPGGRKQHSVPTPITGGLAIALAVFVSLSLVDGNFNAFAAYAVAAALLVVVGLLDDALDLKWWWRLIAQASAALIMVYWGGVQVDYIGVLVFGQPLSLGHFAVPFTVFATVGIINAVNMCDGSDGLAGTLCLAGLAMMGLAAMYAGNELVVTSILPLIASVAVFLAFNMRFPWQRRARVFMGNAGSAFLGFSMAWVTFRLTQNGAHPVSPVLAPWLLAPPLIDCLVLIVRRLKAGHSPFAADRGHMHHLMLDAGFTPGAIAGVLGALSLSLGMAAALVLRSVWGTEGHLVVGFIMLLLGYYWMTSRRDRAVACFRRLRLALEASGMLSPKERESPFPVGGES